MIHVRSLSRIPQRPPWRARARRSLQPPATCRPSDGRLLKLTEMGPSVPRTELQGLRLALKGANEVAPPEEEVQRGVRESHGEDLIVTEYMETRLNSYSYILSSSCE